MKIKHLVFTAFLSVCITGATAHRTLAADTAAAGPVSLFDGQTLSGWFMAPTNSTTFSGGDIADVPAFVKRLSDKADPVSAFLSDKLDATAKAALADYSPTNANPRALKSALAKTLTAVVSGPSIYDETRFKGVQLRPETEELLHKNPQGPDRARLNRTLLEDAYPKELASTPATAWIVKAGAMASTEAGRGTIYTVGDYSHYRLTFTMRHVSGKPDHQACILIFCTRPAPGEKGMDALGGIQFQVPNGGHWDYRKGHNNGGTGEFTQVPHPKFDVHEWSRIEIVADSATGVARMAVAQPVGAKAVEVLDFKEPTAGQTGPIALQMHNAGLFDEYKDIQIEVSPTTDDLVTTK